MKQMILVVCASLSIAAAGGCKKDEKKDAPQEQAAPTPPAAKNTDVTPVSDTQPAAADPALAEVDALKAQCAASEAARMARHKARPLFERLGGEAKIEEMVAEVVRLHKQNDKIKEMFAKADEKKLVKSIASFIVMGTGGPANYKGPDMKTAHAKLGVKPEHFVAAERDIAIALKTLNVGPDETEEVLCAVVGLYGEVVTP